MLSGVKCRQVYKRRRIELKYMLYNVIKVTEKLKGVRVESFESRN